MNIIIDDRKFEGFHQYVFWNNKFFKSEDIDDSDLHVHWAASLSESLDADPLPEDFVPNSCVIASHVVQLNKLFKKIKRANGRFNIVLYSKDGGIQRQEESIDKGYRTKQGYCITYKIDGGREILSRIPQNVNKIFCSNVNFTDDQIICYPYGVMEDTASSIQKLFKTGQERNLCYANFNTHTNREHRIPIWEKMRKIDWVNCNELTGIEQYVSSLYDHKYVVCPKGHGIDTMRMWESIYCGAIPIVQKSGVSSCFSSSLPIMEVDNWNLDKKCLEDIYLPMADRISDSNLMNKDYWKDMINEL